MCSDTRKKELDDEKYNASTLVNDLKSQVKKDKKNGGDAAATKAKLDVAEEKLAAAKKALDDYTADVESHNLPEPSTGSRAVTNGGSQATGVENQAANAKPKKSRSWGLRPRGPQAQTVP